MLSCGTIRPVHRTWFDSVQARLRDVDLELLRAVTPATGWIASFYLCWANGPDTRMDDQVSRLADLPADVVSAKVHKVWNGQPVPQRAAELTRPGGIRRLADALWDYWQAAIEPHWSTIRAVLDDDVAHRARTLSTAGMQPLLTGLHDQVRWQDQIMLIGERDFDDRDDEAVNGPGCCLCPRCSRGPTSSSSRRRPARQSDLSRTRNRQPVGTQARARRRDGSRRAVRSQPGRDSSGADSAPQHQ